MLFGYLLFWSDKGWKGMYNIYVATSLLSRMLKENSMIPCAATIDYDLNTRVDFLYSCMLE